MCWEEPFLRKIWPLKPKGQDAINVGIHSGVDTAFVGAVVEWA